MNDTTQTDYTIRQVLKNRVAELERENRDLQERIMELEEGIKVSRTALDTEDRIEAAGRLAKQFADMRLRIAKLEIQIRERAQ